jgi:hypothetical protein
VRGEAPEQGGGGSPKHLRAGEGDVECARAGPEGKKRMCVGSVGTAEYQTGLAQAWSALKF